MATPESKASLVGVGLGRADGEETRLGDGFGEAGVDPAFGEHAATKRRRRSAVPARFDPARFNRSAPWPPP